MYVMVSGFFLIVHMHRRHTIKSVYGWLCVEYVNAKQLHYSVNKVDKALAINADHAREMRSSEEKMAKEISPIKVCGM